MNNKLETIRNNSEAIIDNIETVIVGKRDRIKLVLTAFLCKGHILINDVPGLGKTVLAKSFSKTIGGIFKRIQATPDLLPSDITGVSIFNPDIKKFVFRKGPIFSQILLIDEINRATPRTQSALLESMSENQVSIEGSSIPVPDPFFVIATQNPIEFEGTFPLPEAQLDRFIFSIDLGYPTSEEEMAIVANQNDHHPLNDIKEIISIEEISKMRNVISTIFVKDDIKKYIIRLVNATRNDDRLFLGTSPRGTIYLYKAAQAWAMLEGRDFVTPDDIKYLAPFVLSHRVIAKAESKLKGYTANDIISDIIATMEVPLAE